MPDFVSKVADEGAMRLAHLDPRPLPLGVVRLFDIDGDESRIVPGVDLLALALRGLPPVAAGWEHIGLEIERQGRVERRVGRGQSEHVQRVEHPPLARFQPCPFLEVARDG